MILIDDDGSVRRALKMQLGVLGFQVKVFATAEELLAEGISGRHTCLLSDVYLPGMNGIELCQQMEQAGAELPVILMTGRDDERTRRLMREAKPVACLFKPFDQAELLRAIRKALSPRLKTRR